MFISTLQDFIVATLSGSSFRLDASGALYTDAAQSEASPDIAGLSSEQYVALMHSRQQLQDKMLALVRGSAAADSCVWNRLPPADVETSPGKLASNVLTCLLRVQEGPGIEPDNPVVAALLTQAVADLPVQQDLDKGLLRCCAASALSREALPVIPTINALQYICTGSVQHVHQALQYPASFSGSDGRLNLEHPTIAECLKFFTAKKRAALPGLPESFFIQLKEDLRNTQPDISGSLQEIFEASAARAGCALYPQPLASAPVSRASTPQTSHSGTPESAPPPAFPQTANPGTSAPVFPQTSIPTFSQASDPGTPVPAPAFPQTSALAGQPAQTLPGVPASSAAFLQILPSAFPQTSDLGTWESAPALTFPQTTTPVFPQTSIPQTSEAVWSQSSGQSEGQLPLPPQIQMQPQLLTVSQDQVQSTEQYLASLQAQALQQNQALQQVQTLLLLQGQSLQQAHAQIMRQTQELQQARARAIQQTRELQQAQTAQQARELALRHIQVQTLPVECIQAGTQTVSKREAGIQTSGIAHARAATQTQVMKQAGSQTPPVAQRQKETQTGPVEHTGIQTTAIVYAQAETQTQAMKQTETQTQPVKQGGRPAVLRAVPPQSGRPSAPLRVASPDIESISDWSASPVPTESGPPPQRRKRPSASLRSESPEIRSPPDRPASPAQREPGAMPQIPGRAMPPGQPVPQPATEESGSPAVYEPARQIVQAIHSRYPQFNKEMLWAFARHLLEKTVQTERGEIGSQQAVEVQLDTIMRQLENPGLLKQNDGRLHVESMAVLLTIEYITGKLCGKENPEKAVVNGAVKLLLGANLVTRLKSPLLTVVERCVAEVAQALTDFSYDYPEKPVCPYNIACYAHALRLLPVAQRLFPYVSGRLLRSIVICILLHITPPYERSSFKPIEKNFPYALANALRWQWPSTSHRFLQLSLPGVQGTVEYAVKIAREAYPGVTKPDILRCVYDIVSKIPMKDMKPSPPAFMENMCLKIAETLKKQLEEQPGVMPDFEAVTAIVLVAAGVGPQPSPSVSAVPEQQ